MNYVKSPLKKRVSIISPVQWPAIAANFCTGLNRRICFRDRLELSEISELLNSEYHEIRLFALFNLVEQYSKAEVNLKTKIYNFYLSHTQCINNWDLVDSSAHHIVGQFLQDKERTVLYRLVQSDLLWERRIAIISTFYFIKNNDFTDALAISEHLLNDSEDLIHKASGWMLREVGKRDMAQEITFLNKHYKRMPRTMLRYAIEKFNPSERQTYLKGLV